MKWVELDVERAWLDPADVEEMDGRDFGETSESALLEIAGQMRAYGFNDDAPVCVERSDDGRYRAIDGRHRAIAAQHADLEQIPALVISAGECVRLKTAEGLGLEEIAELMVRQG